jgi:SAM-dependent methyltransferase
VRDAVLVLKSNPAALDDARETVESVRGAGARILLCCEAWSEAQVHALHARGDCYVSLHKGEGWGYPLFEAAARGKPVVATDYSGPRDYLDRTRHWLVRHRPCPVRQRYHLYNSNMGWADPDVSHAAQGLRWIYEHREDARRAASEAARRLELEYSLERIGAAAEARLLHLVGRRSARKAAWLRRSSLERLRPSVPIPPEWFDADYFDLGRKSNWSRGYSWPLFEGVFRNAARYLADLFPEARSFLDVGCGKGFLVRALRERGLDAWGFDFSGYAVAHAEPSAKPYIQLADAGTARYERQFDVVIAMSVLESLTEAQIRDFLPRARDWTKTALLAVIAANDRHGDGAVKTLDRDLSRVTLRDRTWWRSEFRDAGWRQDHEWLDFERRCRSHPVAKAMNWDVHVFAAGR